MSAKMSRPISTIAAVGAVALMVLTGCSNSEPTGDGVPSSFKEGVFDFTYMSHVGEPGELLIRMPDGLSEATASDLGELLITEAKLAPIELESSKYCAFEAELSYAGDAPDVLVAPKYTQAEWEKQQEDIFLEIVATEFIYEMDAAMEAGLIAGDEEVRRWREVGTVTMKHAESFIETGLDRADELQQLKEELISNSQPPHAWYFLTSVKPDTDFDASSPEVGAFHSSDYKTLTFVERCATSPMDGGDAELEFPIMSDGKLQTLATVELSVMKSGALSVTSSEINGFVRDSDGNWLQR